MNSQESAGTSASLSGLTSRSNRSRRQQPGAEGGDNVAPDPDNERACRQLVVTRDRRPRANLFVLLVHAFVCLAYARLCALMRRLPEYVRERSKRRWTKIVRAVRDVVSRARWRVRRAWERCVEVAGERLAHMMRVASRYKNIFFSYFRGLVIRCCKSLLAWWAFILCRTFRGERHYVYAAEHNHSQEEDRPFHPVPPEDRARWTADWVSATHTGDGDDTSSSETSRDDRVPEGLFREYEPDIDEMANTAGVHARSGNSPRDSQLGSSNGEITETDNLVAHDVLILTVGTIYTVAEFIITNALYVLMLVVVASFAVVGATWFMWRLLRWILRFVWDVLRYRPDRRPAKPVRKRSDRSSDSEFTGVSSTTKSSNPRDSREGSSHGEITESDQMQGRGGGGKRRKGPSYQDLMRELQGMRAQERANKPFLDPNVACPPVNHVFEEEPDEMPEAAAPQVPKAPMPPAGEGLNDASSVSSSTSSSAKKTKSSKSSSDEKGPLDHLSKYCREPYTTGGQFSYAFQGTMENTVYVEELPEEVLSWMRTGNLPADYVQPAKPSLKNIVKALCATLMYWLLAFIMESFHHFTTFSLSPIGRRRLNAWLLNHPFVVETFFRFCDFVENKKKLYVGQVRAWWLVAFTDMNVRGSRLANPMYGERFTSGVSVRRFVYRPDNNAVYYDEDVTFTSGRVQLELQPSYSIYTLYALEINPELAGQLVREEVLSVGRFDQRTARRAHEPTLNKQPEELSLSIIAFNRDNTVNRHQTEHDQGMQAAEYFMAYNKHCLSRSSRAVASLNRLPGPVARTDYMAW